MRRRRYTRASFSRRRRGFQRAYTYKRKAYSNSYVQGTTIADTTGALTFFLAGVPNYTEFTALYDQYKITRVVCEFIPKNTPAELGNGTIAPSQFWTYPDFDDNTAPPNLATVLQRQAVVRTKNTQFHKRILCPRISKPVYQDGISFAYSPGKAWIDCTNPSVPHYGLKYFMEKATNASSITAYDLQITYYLAFRNVL